MKKQKEEMRLTPAGLKSIGANDAIKGDVLRVRGDHKAQPYHNQNLR